MSASRRLLLAALVALVVGTGFAPAGGRAAWPSTHARQTAEDRPPVFAYYYIWFEQRSWRRAKTDYPVLGRYASDDEAILRQHVRWAKRAGITGFIVSWKHTPALTAKLQLLAKVSREEDFKLEVIYQGLNVEREPLPVSDIVQDLRLFAEQFGEDPVFGALGKPIVILSGTWAYSREELAVITGGAYRQQVRILASERSLAGYERVADLFDGNAYYWSSVNPDTFPGYPEKLRAMADAVRARGGVWIAPAAPGFDARLIGGTTIVERKDGETLRVELETALRSDPDILGLISWNEFSENSHVEPSCVHGDRYLVVLAELLDGLPPDDVGPCQESLAINVATPVIAAGTDVSGDDPETAAGDIVIDDVGMTDPVEADAVSIDPSLTNVSDNQRSDFDSSSPSGVGRPLGRLMAVLLFGALFLAAATVIGGRGRRSAPHASPSVETHA